MSHFRTISVELFRRVLPTTLLVAWTVLAGTAWADNAERRDSACAFATHLDLNASLRVAGESEAFVARLDVPSAGLLSLDATVPGDTAGAVQLVAADCGDPQEAPPTVVLDRSATHLVVAVGPGSYTFRVVPQDPSVPFADLKLRAAFVSDEIDGAPDTPQSKEGEDEEEIELEPDPFRHPGLGEGRSLHARLDALCRRGAQENDDHGDSFTCATHLTPGRAVAGEIRNGWGDDADVYRITVGDSHDAQLRTLTLETTGDLDTFGTLYDRFGQPLQKVDGGGGDGNFRLVRTLAPGTYFVRVEGRDGFEGPYVLHADAAAF